MENIIQSIINDLQKHGENIDKFNQEMMGNVQRTSNETLDTLLNILSLERSVKKEKKGPTTTLYNPYKE